MAGLTRQIQIRHIVVAKEEVASLLKATINEVSSETGRVKMLMSLAEKYSLCSSKNDGGNLGWLEVVMDPNDPRNPRGGYNQLANVELDEIIRTAVRDLDLVKGVLYGPVKTGQGYHLVMAANEFVTNRIL